MRVHLVNPSHVSFGTGVITPRWLYVLAGATPSGWGAPEIADETVEPFDPSGVAPGDVVGLGIQTGNALRGYDLGRLARERGAWVVFGGIHATLYPDEARALGGAHAVVRGDGDAIWATVLRDCAAGAPAPVYEAGRIPADQFAPARWDLLPSGRYMWGSIQTVRGCPKQCSFCSVWRTDGRLPRQPPVESVVAEAVELRRRGFRYIALADDNFYPVSPEDCARASRQGNERLLRHLDQMRAARFALMEGLSRLPDDMVFFTQITLEAARDEVFLQAMNRARIRGALVGIEAVTPEGLQDVRKPFNPTGDALIRHLQAFTRNGIHVLGSFIFGLPSDNPGTFAATADLADRAGVAFAQFVMLTPYPGTTDFQRWERTMAGSAPAVDGIPVTRHWLIPHARRPKVYMPHPVMSADQIRRGTQEAWDRFYALGRVWRRSMVTPTWKSRLAFLATSRLYRQMYANTGITTNSGRHDRSVRIARWIARSCRLLFAGAPMPDLRIPDLPSRHDPADAPRPQGGPHDFAPSRRIRARLYAGVPGDLGSGCAGGHAPQPAAD
jgi:hypothetical protein